MGNIYHNKARGLVRGRLCLLLFLLAFIFSLTGLSKMSGMRILADTKYNAKYPRLVDKADVLTDEEEKKLLKKLNKISEEEKVDVVVLTVENEAGEDVTAFADDFYDYNNYGFGHKGDGIILVVDYGTRDWALSTKGKGIYIFTDAGQKYISDKFVKYLSDGEAYEGFKTYANLCKKFIEQYRTGAAYDVGNMPKEKSETPTEDYSQRRKAARMVDNAKVLSLENKNMLNSKLDVASSARNADISILTLKNEVNDNNILSYAGKYYKDNNFGLGPSKDGVLLVMDFGTNTWAIYTNGRAVNAIPDEAKEYMTNDFLPVIKKGDTYTGFIRYINLCDKMLANYDSGLTYDEGLVPKKEKLSDVVKDSVLPALFFSLIICIILTRQLKTVKPELQANNYARQDSFCLTDAEDLFLYKTLSKTRRSRSSSSGSSRGGSSTHRSSSGSTHGGSHGKF